MTKENARDFLPLVQALAEGKTIQYYNSWYDEWEDMKEPMFNFDTKYYRIKPDELWYVVQSHQGYEIKSSSEFETDPCREFESSDKSECEKWIEAHKPQYVPFDTVEELIDCWNQKKNNREPTYDTKLEMPLIWIKRKNIKLKCLITTFWETNVFICDHYVSLDKLFENYTFLDGSPIGKIKE